MNHLAAILVVAIAMASAVLGHSVSSSSSSSTTTTTIREPSTTSASPSVSTIADVPEVAFGLPIPQGQSYVVKSIAPGVYFVTDSTYNTMFLTTGKGVIVVDAPPALRMTEAIRSVTSEPIKYVIYSHSHADHVSGASQYPKDAVFIAHKETADRLREQNDPNRLAPFGAFVGGAPVPLPSVTFDNKFKLKLGNQELRLTGGNDHEPGNIFIYVPKHKVLAHIDLISPGWVPFRNLAASESVNEFFRAHSKVLSFDFTVLVGGHYGRPGTRQDVLTQLEYVDTVRTNAAAALRNITIGSVGAQVGFTNKALLVETFLTRLNEFCANATIPVWRNRLGGVQVWTPSHCGQLVKMHRLE